MGQTPMRISKTGIFQAIIFGATAWAFFAYEPIVGHPEPIQHPKPLIIQAPGLYQPGAKDIPGEPLLENTDSLAEIYDPNHMYFQDNIYNKLNEPDYWEDYFSH